MAHAAAVGCVVAPTAPSWQAQASATGFNGLGINYAYVRARAQVKLKG
jgi:hypothetical protein